MLPYEYVRTQFELEENDTVLKSLANGRKFYIGPFGTPTLNDLDRRLDEATSSRVDTNFNTNVDESATKNNGEAESLLQFEHLVGDVGAFHMDPQNEGAVFQAASQFNCLEMVGPTVTPDDGITRYEYDRTQGPICAIACSPGTLYRNYFVNGHGQGGKEGSQIDCLDEIGASLGNEEFNFWTMENGYMFPCESNSMRRLGRHIRTLCKPKKDAKRKSASSNISTDKEEETGVTLRGEIMGALKVGVQWDTEVVAIKSPRSAKNKQGEKAPPMPHCVTQVYSSALPIAYDDTLTRKKDFEEFARIVLDATYHATFAVAAIKAVEASNNDTDDGTKEEKRVNLFLTKVGGGVFGNPSEWIIDSIKRSCEKYKQFPLNVYLVHYGRLDRDYVRGLKDL
mmetsp:Transcript_4358/g.6394  ORF Transcript_4358/g.6394 Transcript_4358/m.6394 type:complete len:396 (+) Transcript_4358:57-1244(+)